MTLTRRQTASPLYPRKPATPRFLPLAGLLLACCAGSAQAQDPHDISIGVLTIRSPAQTMASWQPTADYLSQAVPGYHFEIRPLDAGQINEAAASGELDFVLTNPAHYVYLEARHRITRIATLIRAQDGKPVKAFGGVILVRSDRPDINRLEDLKGKKISAVGIEWLGAYQAQSAELLQAGIDPRHDSQLSFTGEPQDRVLHDLDNGYADAGFVRTGLIEELAIEGKRRISEFKVIHPQTVPGFPFLLSTRIYPEWPIATSPQTPSELASRVAVALLSLPASSPSAKAGNYLGWSIPADYQSVHDLMKTLRLPPYDVPGPFSLRDVVQKYSAAMMAALFFALGLSLLVVFRFVTLNRTIRCQIETVNRNAASLKSEIAARTTAEQGLRLSASVFEHANDGIIITSPDNLIVEVNQAFCDITGYERDEVIGKNPRLLQSGRHENGFYQAMWEEINNTGHWRGEVWNRRKGGSFYVESLDVTAVLDAHGRVAHYVGIFSDITTLKHSQKKMERLAHFDALTQLPNRTLLADRLEQGVAYAARENQLLAVCFLDLDGFKPVNDEYGHQIGDQLLINIAARFRKALREVDSAARLGGDEFVLLISSLRDMQELEQVLARVMAEIERPHRIGEHELNVSASIGVTVYPLDDADPDSLLRHADQAMYMAKRSGRNRYCLFDIEEERNTQSHVMQLEQLRRALLQDELVLYYQPKVNMRSGQVIGAEALIRWNHPARGLQLPGTFLPLTENHDLACEIGDWVIARALEQINRWLQDGLDLVVSVNIAARHLQQADFVGRLKQHLAPYPKEVASRLELEILESVALEDLAALHELISACHEMHVTFSLDDFGTGYSSLAYLKRLPIDTLKIDRSFIRDLLDNPEDLAIVEGVVSLAKVFRRNVIGEGVETPEHGVMLMRLGCDLAQGFGIAHPMPAGELPAWCGSFTPDPQWALWAEIPWEYADFPLLVAQSDHTHWVRSIIRLVEGVSLNLNREEITDHHQCRFGGWLYSQGRSRYGNLPEFDVIEPLHIRVHQLGLEIVGHVEHGRREQAEALLPELRLLKKLILGHLAKLQRAVTQKYSPRQDATAANP